MTPSDNMVVNNERSYTILRWKNVDLNYFYDVTEILSRVDKVLHYRKA